MPGAVLGTDAAVNKTNPLASPSSHSEPPNDWFICWSVVFRRPAHPQLKGCLVRRRGISVSSLMVGTFLNVKMYPKQDLHIILKCYPSNRLVITKGRGSTQR